MWLTLFRPFFIMLFILTKLNTAKHWVQSSQNNDSKGYIYSQHI
jgi:hypothetical protein